VSIHTARTVIAIVTVKGNPCSGTHRIKSVATHTVRTVFFVTFIAIITVTVTVNICVNIDIAAIRTFFICLRVRTTLAEQAIITIAAVIAFNIHVNFADTLIANAVFTRTVCTFTDFARTLVTFTFVFTDTFAAVALFTSTFRTLADTVTVCFVNSAPLFVNVTCQSDKETEDLQCIAYSYSVTGNHCRFECNFVSVEYA
jgi:hypothetical protein